MRLYVPLVWQQDGENSGALYRVNVGDATGWDCPEPIGETKQRMIGMRRYFEETIFQQRSKVSVSLSAPGDESFLDTIDDTTQSVLLGLFLGIEQHIGNLRLSGTGVDGMQEPIPIGSITVTGNISFPERTPALPLLEAVDDIEEKFSIFSQAIKGFSQDEQGRMHLFIYVTEYHERLPIAEGLHGKNITVKAFTPESGIVDIKTYLSLGHDPHIGSKEYDQYKAYGDLFSRYAENPDMNRSYHLRQASDYYTLAFAVSKKIRIRSHIDLGNLYGKFATYSNPKGNIKSALEHYVHALAIIGSKESYPAEYAEDYAAYYTEAMAGRAIALTDKSILESSWGELEQFVENLQSENLIKVKVLGSMGDFKNRMDEYFEPAVESYKHFLEKETHPDKVRELKFRLAVVLSRRSDVRADIKEVLLKEALSLLDDPILSDTFLKREKLLQYADWQKALGDIYQRLSYFTDREANAQRAIKAYTNQRQIYTKATYPTRYGRVCYDLSTTYMSAYTATDTISYASLAKAFAEEALTVFKKEEFPIDYASTKTYFANACAALLYKTRDGSYFESTLKAYEESLEIYTEDEYPFWHGRVLHNIGELYRKYALSATLCSKEQRVRYLKDALKNFDEALRLRTASKNYLIYHCITQLQKGRAYIDLARQEEPNYYFTQALVVFDEAISVCLDTDALIKGRLYNNKGIALEGLYMSSGNKEYLYESIKHVQQALTYTQCDMPERTRMEQDLQRINDEASKT